MEKGRFARTTFPSERYLLLRFQLETGNGKDRLDPPIGSGVVFSEIRDFQECHALIQLRSTHASNMDAPTLGNLSFNEMLRKLVRITDISAGWRGDFPNPASGLDQSS